MRIIIILFFTSIFLFSKELTPISLQLIWKYQFQFAGYIMAKEKGFYKELGLDVDIREYEMGKLPVDEVKKGNAHFGIARSDLIESRLNKNIKYLQLLAVCQASPVIMQTIKKHNIKKLEDMRNKKLLAYDDIMIASISSMLHSVGIKRSDLTPTKVEVNGLDDLINGRVELIEGYSTITPYHLKKMGYEPVSFHPKDYGFDFYGDILFTMDSYAKENPLVVDDFYKASLRGWKYAFSNIDETIKVIKTKYDTQNLEEEILRFEANEYKKLAFFPGVPFGNINPIKLEKIANTFRLLGKTKSSKSNFENFIYKPSSNTQLKLTKKELAFIENNPIIRIGIRTDLYPIDYLNKRGLHKGVSQDILEYISQVTSLRFMHLKLDENELFDSLNKKEIDMFVTTKNIEENFLITTSLFNFHEEKFIKNKDKKTVKIVEPKRIDIYIVLDEKSLLLKNIIEKAMSQLTLEQRESIHNKWIPKVLKEEFDWTIIWQLFGVTSIIIIILLYRNIQQKNSEKRRLAFLVDEKTNALQIALDEKALLLKELNHRVKNNMQTIISLIRLQSSKQDDEKLTDIFTTIQNRIKAMSHLHELLYKQDAIEYIDTYEYFETICAELLSSFEKEVEIKLDICSDIKLENAVYCGIILNELVTNSLKYAFSSKNAELYVHLSKQTNKYIFIVRDNGIGFDKDIERNSLGLVLVKKLAKKQLKGKISIDSLNKTEIKIEWKDE